MKRSNPAMNKPSLGKVNADLNRFKPNKDSKKTYVFECPKCGNTFTFKESDLKERVIQCDKCKYEEIFFSCNYN